MLWSIISVFYILQSWWDWFFRVDFFSIWFPPSIRWNQYNNEAPSALYWRLVVYALWVGILRLPKRFLSLFSRQCPSPTPHGILHFRTISKGTKRTSTIFSGPPPYPLHFIFSFAPPIPPLTVLYAHLSSTAGDESGPMVHGEIGD